MSHLTKPITVKLDEEHHAFLLHNVVEFSYSSKHYVSLSNYSDAPATFCFEKNIFDLQDSVQQGDSTICFDVPAMTNKAVKVSSSAKNSEVEFTVSLTLPESEFLRNGSTSTTGKIKVND